MTSRWITFATALSAMLLAGAVQAQEVVRLGNLKFAHYGAVSYIKEIAPKCGIKVEEKVFAKGLGRDAGDHRRRARRRHHRIGGGHFRPRQRRADRGGGRLRQGRRAPGGAPRPGHQDASRISRARRSA